MAIASRQNFLPLKPHRNQSLNALTLPAALFTQQIPDLKRDSFSPYRGYIRAIRGEIFGKIEKLKSPIQY